MLNMRTQYSLPPARRAANRLKDLRREFCLQTNFVLYLPNVEFVLFNCLFISSIHSTFVCLFFFYHFAFSTYSFWRTRVFPSCVYLQAFGLICGVCLPLFGGCSENTSLSYDVLQRKLCFKDTDNAFLNKNPLIRTINGTLRLSDWSTFKAAIMLISCNERPAIILSSIVLFNNLSRKVLWCHLLS